MLLKRIKKVIALSVCTVIFATSIPVIKGNAQGLENENITKIHQEEFLNEDSSIVVTRTIGEIENSDTLNIETEIDIKLDRNDFDSDEAFEIALSNAIDTIKVPKLSRAYIGEKRTNTVKFSNGTIGAIGTLTGLTAKVSFIKNLIIKSIGVGLLSVVGYFVAACQAIAAYNTVTGYSGVQVKMTYTYGKHRAWDTDQYVDYLGWSVGSYNISRYK